MVRAIETPNWAAARAMVPEDEAATVERLADAVPDLLRAMHAVPPGDAAGGEDSLIDAGALGEEFGPTP